MRICIAYSARYSKKIEEYARSLGKGIEKQSNTVIDIIDIDKDSDKKLTAYSYVLFGFSKPSLLNFKVNKSFSIFLKNCGHISGKHSYVFTAKSFGSNKFLLNFMKEVEGQGVLLKSSTMISSKEEATIIGSKLHLK